MKQKRGGEKRERVLSLIFLTFGVFGFSRLHTRVKNERKRNALLSPIPNLSSAPKRRRAPHRRVRGAGRLPHGPRQVLQDVGVGAGDPARAAPACASSAWAPASALEPGFLVVPQAHDRALLRAVYFEKEGDSERGEEGGEQRKKKRVSFSFGAVEASVSPPPPPLPPPQPHRVKPRLRAPRVRLQRPLPRPHRHGLQLRAGAALGEVPLPGRVEAQRFLELPLRGDALARDPGPRLPAQRRGRPPAASCSRSRLGGGAEGGGARRPEEAQRAADDPADDRCRVPRAAAAPPRPEGAADSVAAAAGLGPRSHGDELRRGAGELRGGRGSGRRGGRGRRGAR